MARKLSAERGLDRRERLFVQILVSSMDDEGSYDLVPSYRRAYGVERDDGEIVYPEHDVEAMSAANRRIALQEAPMLNANKLAQKAQGTLQRKAVQRYLEELTQTSTVRFAEMVFEDMVRTGTGKERRDAAARIIDDREKVQRRQMVEEFWAISAEVGGECDVPLPGEVRRTVMCPCGCKHEMEVSIPIRARFPGKTALSSRSAPEGHIRVGVRDLKERRAYLHLGPEAKVALAHLAGAPWSEVDPDAKLSDLQVEALQAPERTKILHGGSGVGKSVTGGLEAALDTWIPYNLVGVLGQSYENVAPEFEFVDRFYRKIFGGDESLFIRIANINRSNYHDFEVTTIWGSTCRGFSLDHNEGAVALGKSLDTAVIGEGAFVSTETMNTKVRRALDRSLMRRPGYEPRETGRLVIMTTPNNVDGCAADIVNAANRLTRKQLWKLSYNAVPYTESLWFREATVLENPSYDPAIVKARRKEMEAQGRLAEFEMVYEGKMSAKSGLVYSNFKEERHVIPLPGIEHRRQMRFALGVDTGHYKGSILVGHDRERRTYWLGEVKTQGMLLSATCEQICEMVLERMPWDFPDIAQAMQRIDLHIPDPASQQKLELEENIPGFSISAPSWQYGKFELDPTVDFINNMFKDDKLFIVEDLDWTLDEIRNYRWKSGKSQVRRGMLWVREVARENDHCLDAARYATVPLVELGPLETEPDQMTLQEAWDRQTEREIFGTLRDELAAAEEAGGLWIGGLN